MPVIRILSATAASSDEAHMVIALLKVVAFAPAGFALLVAGAEIRSDSRLIDKIRRLVLAGVAVALVVFFLLFNRITDVNSSFTTWLAGCMTALAIVVGVSGVLVGYSRKSSSILGSYWRTTGPPSAC